MFFVSLFFGVLVVVACVYLIENYGDRLAVALRGSGTLRGGRRFDVEDMLAGVEGRDRLRRFDWLDRERLVHFPPARDARQLYLQ